MTWCDMDSICNFYMAAVINIVSRHGLRTEAHCRKQMNKTKLVMCKAVSYFYKD